ncbi:MAG TPA: hypothetical protein VNU26_13320, partial [Mycobacteriales bacterium]|nr:hypothetical protein [Mycobacteriales bacterium]
VGGDRGPLRRPGALSRGWGTVRGGARAPGAIRVARGQRFDSPRTLAAVWDGLLRGVAVDLRHPLVSA